MWWIGGMIIVLVISIGYMLQWALHRSVFWMALFPLVAFVGGLGGYFFFVTSTVGKWSFFIFLPLFVGVYLETLFTKHFQEQRYTQHSLPAVAFLLNVVGACTLFAFLFALYLIAVLPLWSLVTFGLVFGALHMQHQLWSYQVWDRRTVMVAVIVGVLTAELVWVLHFWPTAFTMNGIVVSILLYCIPSLVQLQFRKALTPALVWRYVGVSIVASIAVFVTSAWS